MPSDDEIVIIIPEANDNITVDVSPSEGSVDVETEETNDSISTDLVGDKYYCDLAKDWAIKTDGKVLGQDYSSKYYAYLAQQIEEQVAQNTEDAQIWAEGTDAQVQALGGEHSSKGWVNYVLTNPPLAYVEQTETGYTLTVTDINGTTTANLYNGQDGAPGQNGVDGTDGADGIGISSINKTSTSGLVDTYTIYLTDNNSYNFTVTNGQDGAKGDNGDTGNTGATGATGNGIANIAKTSTSGLVDTYTITYTNADTDNFTVTNGQNGTNGTNGTDGQDGVSVTGVTLISTVGKVKTYRMAFSDNTYFDYEVTDGADSGITNYVTTDTAQDITGVKTFVGQKMIAFKQSTSSNKLGFTLYNNSGTEKGYLEYNPSNTVDSVPLMTLGNYASSAAGLTHVGFRKYSSVSGASGAYNLLAPLISDARTPFNLTTTYTNFYLPLGFTDGNTTVLTAKTGLVDISSLLPTVPPNISAFNNDSGYITSSALNGYATESWVGQQGYITGINSSDVTMALGFTPVDKSGDTMTGDLILPSLDFSENSQKAATTEFVRQWAYGEIVVKTGELISADVTLNGSTDLLYNFGTQPSGNPYLPADYTTNYYEVYLSLECTSGTALKDYCDIAIKTALLDGYVFCCKAKTQVANVVDIASWAGWVPIGKDGRIYFARSTNWHGNLNMIRARAYRRLN